MKKNLFTILLILSILFLVFCCFVFVFLNGDISVNKKTYEENEMKWQQETDRIEGIKLLNNSILKIEKEKNLLDTHFAYSTNIVPFLDLIESLSTRVGAKTDVTLIDIPKDTNILTIEMNTSGGFEDIYKFILLLENSPYEMETISVDLQNQNSGAVSSNKKIIWQANLKMKLLSFIK